MSIHLQKDDQGIITLTMDMEGRSANLLNGPFMEKFAAAVTSALSDADFKGIIITSAKNDFVAGADLDMMFSTTDPQEAFEIPEHFKGVLRKLELCGKPVVAAMNGTALGGGYELALGCHYRVCIDQKGVLVGLPEATFGMLPGGGGTQKVSRMIGIQNALPFLLEGKIMNPKKALKAGFVDELATDRDDLMHKARAWIQANPAACQPWDRKDWKWPGGNPQSPSMAQMWSITPSMVNQKSFGNYPSSRYILASVAEGSQVDFDTASRIESRYFAAATVSREAKNMITAFWYQLNDIKKGKRRPKGFEPNKVQKLGVLGAGMMGSGIAYASALVGMQVVLKDLDQAAAERGRQHVEKLLNKRLDQGRTTAEQRDQILGLIQPSGDYQDLDGCDLIIEAVFENRELKKEVIGQSEGYLNASGYYASNTSTIPITGLAEYASNAEKFIGLHFFSPVDKMKLVEIIVGKKTSDETLAKAYDYVQQINKTPIVVNDSRGFYTSRVFMTYVLEGMSLLEEGQHPRAIESAGLKAGMPVGPLALTDEISISLVNLILGQTHRDLQAEGSLDTPFQGELVAKRMEDEFGRVGKKANKGFYEYPEGQPKHLWPELQTIFPLKRQELSQAEMIQRMMFIQAIEAAKCFQENVVTSAGDANLGSIFGWGFAPFKGGALQYINDFGLNEFVAECERMQQAYGERFTAPQVVMEKAAKGELF